MSVKRSRHAAIHSGRGRACGRSSGQPDRARRAAAAGTDDASSGAHRTLHRRFVGDRTVVGALACDTFFAAWQHAPHFENRSSVATWLIARYKALSARERQTLPTEPLDEVLATTIVETGLQPDAAVERADWARFLRQCLSSLPAEQAQLIELVYYRDKSIKEVALTMGIPENTVKSRMFLARKKLAAMLNAAEVAGDSVSMVPEPAPAPAQ